MLQVPQTRDDDAPQVTMTSIAISETKHGNPQKKGEDGKKADQDDVLPAKRKRSTNERQAASNGFNSAGSKEGTTSQGEPSITASLQRKAKRNTVVKNPKKGRDTSPTESEKTGSVSPFGKK